MPPESDVLELVVEVLQSKRSPREVCGDDAQLIAEVTSRVKQVRQFSTHLEDLFPVEPATPAARAKTFSTQLPVIPGYELKSVLGRGGIGVVYEARQLRLDRPVALKMLLSGEFAHGVELRRFVREGKAIAALRHPHIVQIFELGEFEGRPFLAMELMEGGTLARKLGGRPCPANESATLLLTLAQAVHAAHEKRIVHRDLKPANVLLSADQTLKISDFGLACQAEDSAITLLGAPMGTPNYMAPEQAAGTAAANQPGVDIYALGAILYEMLTGRPPFQGATALETQQRVMNDIPVSPRNLQPGIPRDLETICCKCLEKQPEKRYASAADLAADLGRFLRNEPIKARPVSWVGQLIRWRRRHPGVAASLSGVALLLALMVVGSFVAMVHFRVLEQQQAKLAIEKSQFAEASEQARGVAVEAERNEAALRQQAEEKTHQLRRALYFEQMNLGGQAALSPSGIGRVQQWLAPWESSELCNWEWYYLNSLCHRDQKTLTGHLFGVFDVAWSPRGNCVASAGADGTVQLWDPASGERRMSLIGHTREVNVLSWNPQGTRLVTAGNDNTCIVWEAATGKPLLKFQHQTPVGAVSWSPDGRTIASGGDDSAIRIWDADTGVERAALQGNGRQVRALAWSPDGTRLAAASSDYNVRIWDPAQRGCVATLVGHINMVNSVAWSRDGKWLASAANDKTVKVWDVHAGTVVATLRGHSMAVLRVAWSPDGTRLASTGDDQTIKVWSAVDGSLLWTCRGHVQPVTSISWAPDSTRLVSSSFDGALKIWGAQTSAECPPFDLQTDGTRSVAWSHDGRWLASGGTDRTITVWNAQTRERYAVLRGPDGWINSISWSPDDVRIAAADEHAVRAWDVATGRQTFMVESPKLVKTVAWSYDSQLASGGDDGCVHVWNFINGSETARLQGHIGPVESIAWSADSTLLASGSTDSTIKIWDVRSAKLKTTLAGHFAKVNSVAWGCDMHRLASASDDQTIRMWDPLTGQPIAIFEGHTTSVLAVAWNPDGSRLASASQDHTVKIWDPRTGDAALSLSTDPVAPLTLAWSPDGMKLAVGGDQHLMQVYDATAGYLAADAPQALTAIDSPLSPIADPAQVWRKRTHIAAHHLDWATATEAAQHYLQLKPDEHWVIEGFSVIGPYPDTLTASFPPETDTNPSHSLPPAEASATSPWLSWHGVPFDQGGFVLFGPVIGNAEHISAYAQVRIYSPGAQRVQLQCTASEQLRLWMNGHKCGDDFEHAAVVPTTLQPGWNTLLARSFKSTSNQTLYLKITPASQSSTGPEQMR